MQDGKGVAWSKRENGMYMSLAYSFRNVTAMQWDNLLVFWFFFHLVNRKNNLVNMNTDLNAQNNVLASY